MDVSIINELNKTGYQGQEGLQELIVDGLNMAIGAAAVICVAVLIFSGYMYITASGDEAKVEKASKSLTFAIVGLAIAFIAVLLVNFVLKNLLGVTA
jgi:TRAP-type C4-dicarboxylate transport system permease small subunit